MRLLGAVSPPIVLFSAARRTLAPHCRLLATLLAPAASTTVAARARGFPTPIGVGRAIGAGCTVFGCQIRRISTARCPITIADDAVTSAAVNFASIPEMKLKTEAQARPRRHAGLARRPTLTLSHTFTLSHPSVSGGVLTRAGRQHGPGQRQAAAKNALRLAGAAMATTASGSHNLHTAGAVLAAVPTTPDKKSIGAPAAVPTDTGSNVAKRGFHLESAARYHSHKPPSPARPSPEITSGEDAFCNIETDRYHVLGVADGVGGWAEHGVDPSLFAWELMNNCTDIAAADSAVLDSGPIALLTAAFERVKSEKKVTAGSSTASVAVLDKQTGLLRGANLGDSAIAVIRRGSFVLKTRDQQHYFNAPYQLAVIPAGTSQTVTDTPDMAAAYETATFPGDLIMLATDGYTDNVFSESTLSMCTHRVEIDGPSDQITPAAQVSTLGDRLLEAALSRSLSSIADTPFSHHAMQAGFPYRGGKKDDITLLIAKVLEADEPVPVDPAGGGGGRSPDTTEPASDQQWNGFTLASSL